MDLSKLSDEELAALEAELTPKSAKEKFREGALSFSNGMYRSLTGLAGLPTDIINAVAGTNLAGSKELQSGLQRLGIDVNSTPRDFMGMLGEYSLPMSRANMARNFLGATAATVGGYTARQVAPDSVLAEMAGALTPAGVRLGATAAAKRALTGGNAQRVAANLNIAQGVGGPITAGAATQSPVLMALEKMVSAIPGGVSAFRASGEQAANAMQNRLTTIAGGSADDVVRAGRTIEQGLFDDLTGWTARTKAKRDNLYAALDAKLGTGAVPASATEQFAQSANRGVPGAPSLSSLLFVDPTVRNQFDALLSDLAASGQTPLMTQQGKTIPYEALKRLRTEVGDALGDPQLIGSARRNLLSGFYKALSADMEAAAVAAGAGKEFARANRYHKARIERIESFYTTLNKKVAPEDVWAAAIGDTPKSATRLNAVKKALTPAEWGYVRQTLITRMGKPVASAAVEGGAEFSAQTFLTNYERMKKNGALRELFGTGQFRSDIDQVAQYASRLRESSQMLSNPSGTAALGLSSSVLFGALGMTAGVLAGGPAAGLVGIAGGTLANNQIARLLNNPRFVHWLAQGTKLPTAQIPNHLGRLAIIAGNDPDLLEVAPEYIRATTGTAPSAQW